VRRPPRFLRPGQTVRIEIEGLGVLENPVVREGEPAGPRAVED
jgi:2-keto-4-pentenoate hydratase/2-oxohepta-3-ene-1,7-dioic acid hydratase in catechol pathway